MERDILIESGPGRRADVPTFTAIRTPRSVYAEHQTAERELYDLERDPHQLTSVHDDPAYARVAAQLAQRLAALRMCSGPACASRPALELVLRAKRGHGNCVRFGVRASVTGADAGLVQSVAFVVRGRVAARDDSPPFERVLPRAAGFVTHADVALRDGRRLVLTARTAACPVPRRR